MEMESTKRQRSPRRLRHEAEIAVFKTKTGDLDEIRRNLNLRPSQICEILKVHPSAWTRWVKSQKAPPHIYQMLEWYIELLKWRGQHIPVPSNLPTQSGEESPLLKKVRNQSPESYVPKEQELKYPEARQNYIEKKVFITILSLSFTVQIAIMIGLIIWLKK